MEQIPRSLADKALAAELRRVAEELNKLADKLDIKEFLKCFNAE